MIRQIRQKAAWLVGMILLAGVLNGCGTAQKDAAEKQTVVLAAAASLENCFEKDLIPLFREQYPDVMIQGVYDSSGKLQIQIEQGLEADIFFSAAQKQMNALKEEGYMKEIVDSMLINEIVMIVPAASSVTESSFEALAEFETVAIGDPESVPAGQYAKEILTHLGIYDTVKEKASLGTNVTEVLNWVGAASADAGVVYATDAAGSQQVRVVAKAPEGSLASPVTYPAGVTRLGAEKSGVALFFEFLNSDEAKKVFESYGFSIPETSERIVMDEG